jgi:hypothetical protein
MAINKNQMTRYRILDRLFRNPMRTYTIYELLDALNEELKDKGYATISERQLKIDIVFMRSEAGWEVEFTEMKEGRKHIYQYADVNFSIEKSPLSESQLEAIAQALDMIQGYGNIEEVQGIMDQLETLKLINSDKLRGKKIIHLSQSMYLKGQHWISVLHQCIREELVVKLVYKPFPLKKEHHWYFSPHILKEYNKRWFVCGKIIDSDFPQTVLALDRIDTIVVEKNKKYSQPEVNWEEYFEDVVGVTVPIDAKVENIGLRFFNGRGHYVQTKPIHGSQKPMKWIDESTSETSIRLKWNKELEAELLSFGKDIEIIREESKL